MDESLRDGAAYKRHDTTPPVPGRPSFSSDARFLAWIGRLMGPRSSPASFQSRAGSWLVACFGHRISGDREERAHRFLEEALELVQAAGCTASEAHQLVDYVYARPPGELGQEVGGVMLTMAGLCLSHGLDMDAAGEAELSRVWTRVDAIRAKQAAKPSLSPLPGAAPGPASASEDPVVQLPAAKEIPACRS